MAQAQVVIHGRVQGVGYRAWTQRTARELSLQGWVRNLEDRTVEAVFVGPRGAIEEMVRRCHEGPRLARVTQVQIDWGPQPPCTGFEIHPDGPGAG